MDLTSSMRRYLALVAATMTTAFRSGVAAGRGRDWSDRDERIQRRGRDLIALVAARLPQEFDTASDSGRWPAIGTGLLSRMSTTLASILDLQHAKLEADAATLVRSLYEHAVHFAWLAADPSPERLEHWQKHDLVQRLKADDDTTAHGVSMLEPERRAQFEAQVATMRGATPLVLADLAIAADDHWAGKLRGMGKHTESTSFRGWYAFLYRTYSGMAHPSAIGLNRVSERIGPTRLRIHIETQTGRTGPYGMATFVFAVALYAASERLGWPAADNIRAIFDRTMETTDASP
jgi:hypothetical protein